MTIPIGLFPDISVVPSRGWSVFKVPSFKTLVPSASSAGREVRLYQNQVPVWDFTLKYDFLRDQTMNATAETPWNGRVEFQAISELFLWCDGRRGNFYFDDPSDDSRSAQFIATADGTTTTFDIIRTWGPATTVIGLQSAGSGGLGTTIYVIGDASDFRVDDVVSIADGVNSATSTISIIGRTQIGTVGGRFVNITPITVTAQFFTVFGAGGYFRSALATDEIVGGVNTGLPIAVYVGAYERPPTQYTITGNQIIFNVAPTAGLCISMDFSFYYRCRFFEDQHQYEEFLYNLWQLGKCRFVSIPVLQSAPLTNRLLAGSGDPIQTGDGTYIDVG